jgi:hypothetical protein
MFVKKKLVRIGVVADPNKKKMYCSVLSNGAATPPKS